MLLNVFIIQLKDSSAAMCKKSETSATHRNHLKVVETVSFTECALCVHQNSARRASQLHSQDSGWSVNPSDGFGINKLYKHNSFISPTTILTIILTIKLEPYIYHLSLAPFKRPFSRWIWVSHYQNVSILDFIAAKDDEGGGDSWSYKSCKAPVKSSPPTNQHPAFYRLDALPVAKPTV